MTIFNEQQIALINLIISHSKYINRIIFVSCHVHTHSVIVYIVIVVFGKLYYLN